MGLKTLFSTIFLKPTVLSTQAIDLAPKLGPGLLIRLFFLHVRLMLDYSPPSIK
jgi:hypothetical protein